MLDHGTGVQSGTPPVLPRETLQVLVQNRSSCLFSVAYSHIMLHTSPISALFDDLYLSASYRCLSSGHHHPLHTFIAEVSSIICAP